jgi:hypothetical protein
MDQQLHREWLSCQVMDEYGDNILAKLSPYLDRQSRILETVPESL